MARHTSSGAATLLFLGLASSACVGPPPPPPADGGAATSTGSGSSTASSMGPIDAGPGSVSSTGEGSSSSTGEGSSTGMVFLPSVDVDSSSIECDLWTQDCPAGEKCMPWANDGGSSWNATRCSPVADNPGQVGDQCTVEGSSASGIDSCDVGTMCYYVDASANLGTCVAFCQGSEAEPLCRDPDSTCTISYGDVLPLCLFTCDPLLQDCAEQATCVPTSDGTAFSCAADASGMMGAPGDPCVHPDACDPGTFCASAEVVPNCQGSGGCCSELCDLTAPDPNAGCSLMGQVCVAWFEEGAAPPGLEDVGACILAM